MGVFDLIADALAQAGVGQRQLVPDGFHGPHHLAPRHRLLFGDVALAKAAGLLRKVRIPGQGKDASHRENGDR
jgi:hypothetical protein